MSGEAADYCAICEASRALMGGRSDIEDSRRFALEQVAHLLGIADLTTEKLLAEARSALGDSRTEQCVRLARLAPLTRRWWATAAIAELIVGSREVGPEWWDSPHDEMTPAGKWETRCTPDALVDAGHAHWTSENSGSCLDVLGNWIADDAASRRWGRPVDYVDLNSMQPDDRIRLPEGARSGDRFTAVWDPGGLVWVDIIERDAPDDRLGRRRTGLGSKLGEFWHNDAAEAWWAWGMATDIGPIQLPGDSTDPFDLRVTDEVAIRLYTWAKEHGATADELGSPWRTKADLWSARFRLGLPYNRAGAWSEFDLAVRAAVDGDDASLKQSLLRLRS